MTRNLIFEWRRASSIRSTWGFPLIGIVLMLVFAIGPALLPEEALGGPATLALMLAGSANALGLIVITVICAQSFGHDYRDGTMRLVLSEFPGRTRVFAAKLIIPAVIVLASILVIQAIVLLASLVFLRLDLGASAGALTLLALRQFVLATWWGLMVAAITALMRNLAGGIMISLVLATIGEGLLVGLIASRWSGIQYFAPFTSAAQWAVTGQARVGLTALAWLALVLGGSLFAFRRRDA